jgi:auxin efflux carrier family protein
VVDPCTPFVHSMPFTATSVALSLTASAPFNPEKDQNLSVAYISVFVLVYMVCNSSLFTIMTHRRGQMTLFPMGAHRLIAKDFVGPDVEHEEVREQVRERRRLLLYGWPKALMQLRRRKSAPRDSNDPESEGSSSPPEKRPEGGNGQEKSENSTLRPRTNRHVSILTEGQNLDDIPSEGMIVSPPPTERILSSAVTATVYDPIENHISPTGQSVKNNDSSDERVAPTPISGRPRRLQAFTAEIKGAIKSMLTPASLSILLAFPIALVPQLKGLFTPTSGSGIPNAPDGEPPLAFILDFATFMGAASVPMALIGLGSALARIQVPRDQWKDLPLGAIFSLAFLKLIVTPVLGVLITGGLVSAGVMDKEDKVIQFVSMYVAGCL